MKTPSKLQLIALAAAGLLGITACDSGTTALQSGLVEHHLSLAGPVEVGFNAPEGLTDPLGDDLTAFIDQADVSLDAALYKVTHPGVVDALLAAHDRGVTVRMVSDTKHRYLKDAGPVYDALEAAGIPIRYDIKKSDMHHKFLVRDGRTVWLGSFNPLDRQVTHAEDALTVADDAIAAAFTREFEEMFVDGLFSRAKSDDTQHLFDLDGTSVEIYFAPKDNVTTQVVDAIAAARHSIRFLAFSFSSDPIADAIIEQFHNGLDVSGAVDRLQANKRGGDFQRMLDEGIDVRRAPFTTFMHHKFLILDEGTADAKVITGSFNFTAQANERNDESLAIIGSTETARAYLAAFDGVMGRCVCLNMPDEVGRDLRITEVHANALSEARDEFIEIVNDSDAVASLYGLYVYDGDAWDRVIPADGGDYEVDAHAVVVIIDRDRGPEAPIADGVRVFTVENGTLGDGLTNNDVVAIYGPDREIPIDVMSFPFNAGNGRSILRTALDAPDALGSWVGGTIQYGTAGIFPEPAEDPWAEPGAEEGRINLNTATAAELTQLFGVGPTTAGRIVTDREANGAFCTVDELTRVYRVGESIVDNNRDLMTVGEPVGCADPDAGPTLIDINTADVPALDTLPGIGPFTANAIIADRELNGPFLVISEITRVKGIGSSTLAKIEALITVE